MYSTPTVNCYAAISLTMQHNIACYTQTFADRNVINSLNYCIETGNKELTNKTMSNTPHYLMVMMSSLRSAEQKVLAIF